MTEQGGAQKPGFDTNLYCKVSAIIRPHLYNCLLHRCWYEIVILSHSAILFLFTPLCPPIHLQADTTFTHPDMLIWLCSCFFAYRRG